MATLVEASKASGNSLGLQFFLIDFENVQPSGLGSLVPGSCRLMMFLGQNQSKVPIDLLRLLQPFGTDVEYLQISGVGPNAVDFHIAFYIGRLAVSHPDAKFTIVSKDKGFDPLIKHLSSLKIACNRVASIGGAGKLPSSAAVLMTKPMAAKARLSAKQKPANDVAVANLPGVIGAADKSKSAAAENAMRLAEVTKRLKGLKSAKPAKLKTLLSSLKSWFKPALNADEVASVIAALKYAKKIKVDGTKVAYTL